MLVLYIDVYYLHWFLRNSLSFNIWNKVDHLIKFVKLLFLFNRLCTGMAIDYVLSFMCCNCRRVVRNEIYAHGILFHNNIVRNFSCWNEDNYVFIQNEYCNGGNLESYIKTNKTTMSETLLRSLMLQIASALK